MASLKFLHFLLPWENHSKRLPKTVTWLRKTCKYSWEPVFMYCYSKDSHENVLTNCMEQPTYIYFPFASESFCLLQIESFGTDMNEKNILFVFPKNVIKFSIQDN